MGDPIKQEYFLNKAIWLIGGILTGTTTHVEGESGSNGYEGVLHTLPGL